MNINPKKSWHVRSKTNIAKVLRDEAKEAAEEAEKKRRTELAESDERWTYLKRTAKERGLGRGESDELEGAVDFFKDVKRGIDGVVAESREYKQEKKEDQEKWEQKIGLLKYLGEGSAELSSEKPWWTQARTSSSGSDAHSLEAAIERDKSSKRKEDPLADVSRSMKKMSDNFPSSSSSSQKHTEGKPQENTVAVVASSSSSSKSVDQLRRERLERERRERERTQALLASRGIIPMPKQQPIEDDERKRPYNSTFNASISSHLRK